MGDTIGTQGMHTVTRDPGYDRRHRRYKNSEGWNDILITNVEAIKLAKDLMGVKSVMVNPKHTPLKLLLEPGVEAVLRANWQPGGGMDEAFLAMLQERPRRVYLRREVNHVLLYGWAKA